jgi:hypothetical protein
MFALCGRATSRADGPSPAVECTVEVVRQTPQGYMVAPTALIPLTARVRDPQGLKSLDYVVTTARQEAPGQFGPEGKEQRAPALSFVRPRRHREGQLSPLIVQEFRTTGIDASLALDLSKLPLPPGDANKPSPPYRLRVWLEAANDDTATGPRTGRSEPLTLVVVREVDLLLEFARAEEVLEYWLDERVAQRLRQAQTRLREVTKQLAAAKPNQMGGLAAQVDQVRTEVTFASASVNFVHNSFQAILQELKANRVRPDMIERVEKTICGPLDELLRKEFDPPVEALREFSKCLDFGDVVESRKAGVPAAEKFDALVARVGKVADAVIDLGRANRQIRERLLLDELLGDGK